MYEYEKNHIAHPKEYLALSEEIEVLKDRLGIFEQEYMEMAKNDVHDTTAIEGNALTRREVTEILENRVTIRGKSVRDHLQVKNYIDALSALKQMVVQKSFSLDHENICTLHSLLTKDEIEPTYCGSYRQENLTLATTTYIPPDYELLPSLLDELFAIYNNPHNYEDTQLEKIAAFHRNFERIHPFVDGNGRVGRFAMNILLLQNGYSYVPIPAEDRLAYFDALENNTFCEFLAEMEYASLKQIESHRK